MTDRARVFDDLIREATTYYVRLQGAPKSHSHRKALLNWIGRSDDHAKAMDLVCRLWVASKTAPPPFAIRTPRRSPSHARFLGYSLAGSFGAVAAIICAVLLTSNTHQLYNNPNYAIQKILMADGTTVFMGPHTSIAIDSSLSNRSIYLYNGIADIDVGHSLRKLHTYVRGFQIKDLGTHFVVANDSDQASVTLISGAVAVLDPNTGQELSRLRPGNMFTWANLKYKRLITLRDTYKAIAWESHVIEFDETPLPEAVEQLHNFTGLNVTLHGKALSHIKISGTFNYNDPNVFFSALSTIYGANVVRIKPGEYVIKM